MDNKEGNMENDLKGFGEAEGSFEISEEIRQNLAEATVRAVDIEKEIERADSNIRQKIESGDVSAADEEFKKIQRLVQGAKENG